MSKIIRINDGDYKLSVRDSTGKLKLTTLEASSITGGNIEISSPNIVINGINDSTIVSTIDHNVSLFDTVATNVTAFSAATSIDIGSSTGVLTVHNASTILDGDLEVSGGDITSLSTTFNLLNQPVTIVAFSSGTDVSIGASGPGVTKIKNDNTIIEGDAEVYGNATIQGNLTVNGTTTTVNSEIMTIDDKNVILNSIDSATDADADTGGLTLKGTTDKTISWDITNNNWTSSENWNIALGKVYKIDNTIVLTPDTILPNSSNVSIGDSTGTFTINNPDTIVNDLAVNGGDLTSTSTSFNLLDNNVTTLYAFGAATSIDIGANSGTLTINNPNTIVDDLAVNGGDITSTSLIFNLLNEPTTINEYSSASTINVGSNNGGDFNLLTTNVHLNTVDATSVQSDTFHVVTEITGTPSAILQSKINFEIITNDTGSIILPSGTALERDTVAQSGYFRFNTDVNNIEFYNGTSWIVVGTGSGNAFITSETGSFITPTGTTAQRDAVPEAGYFRFNTEIGGYEGFTGIDWQPLQLILNIIDGGTYGSSEIPPSVSIDGGSF